MPAPGHRRSAPYCDSLVATGSLLHRLLLAFERRLLASRVSCVLRAFLATGTHACPSDAVRSCTSGHGGTARRRDEGLRRDNPSLRGLHAGRQAEIPAYQSVPLSAFFVPLSTKILNSYTTVIRPSDPSFAPLWAFFVPLTPRIRTLMGVLRTLDPIIRTLMGVLRTLKIHNSYPYRRSSYP